MLLCVEEKMNIEKFKQQEIIEPTDEEVFQAYVEDLRLAPEDFNKRILDVGAGSAQFAKWAKEHGVGREIYSLEPKKEELAKKDKNVAAKAEAIPFENESFDMVISDSAIPNVYVGEVSAEAVKEKVRDSLREMVRVIRPGGEIRLARVLMGEEYESQRILSQSIEEALRNLEAESGVEVEKIRTPSDDTYEYDKYHKKTKLLAEAYLVMIRKRKK